MFVLKLAIKILLHDRTKTLACLAGVSFSVCLVMVQRGIQHGAIGSSSDAIEHSAADLWVLPRGTLNFDCSSRLPEGSEYLVRSMVGVERVETLVVTFSDWRLPTGGSQSVQVIGFEADGVLYRPWKVDRGDVEDLRADRAVFIDGNDCSRLHVDGVGAASEIGRGMIEPMQARIVGLTQGIRTLHSCPIVFTNVKNARAYSRFTERKSSFLLVRVADGCDANVVRTAVETHVPFVECLTQEEFGARTRKHWDQRTGIGVILTVTVLMSVFIGVGVLGMLQYLSTLEQIHEYAMLRALGTPNRRVVGLIAVQGLFLGVSGFGVGFGLTALTELGLNSRVNMVVTVAIMREVFFGSLLLSVGVSLFCAIKVLWTNPALVFKA